MAAKPLSDIALVDRLADLIAQARGLEMAMSGASLEDVERDALETLSTRLVREMVSLHGALDAGGESAAERLSHHLAGAEAAMRDLFPGAHVTVAGNCLDAADTEGRRLFAEGVGGPAHVQITASRGLKP